MITNILLEQKLDNIQHQLDAMAREDAAFRSYVNKQFNRIDKTMVTKDDLKQFASKGDLRQFATKNDLLKVRAEMATKEDLSKLTEIVIKIAEKVGVST
jgi:hypothetical protein